MIQFLLIALFAIEGAHNFSNNYCLQPRDACQIDGDLIVPGLTCGQSVDSVDYVRKPPHIVYQRAKVYSNYSILFEVVGFRHRCQPETISSTNIKLWLLTNVSGFLIKRDFSFVGNGAFRLEAQNGVNTVQKYLPPPPSNAIGGTSLKLRLSIFEQHEDYPFISDFDPSNRLVLIGANMYTLNFQQERFCYRNRLKLVGTFEFNLGFVQNQQQLQNQDNQKEPFVGCGGGSHSGQNQRLSSSVHCLLGISILLMIIINSQK